MQIILGNQGIRELKKLLNKRLHTLDSITDKIALRLAEKGLTLVQSNAPTNDIDGNIAGTASIEQMKDGYRVIYSGQDVAYIEFGTGYKGQLNPYPDTSALNLADWQYDVNGHGVKGWFYKSKRDGSIKHSRGMSPEMPMYRSYKELEDVTKEIIIGVLNDFFTE